VFKKLQYFGMKRCESACENHYGDSMDLDEETAKATEMLKNKIVSKIWRHNERKIGIQFTDGTRLFFHRTQDGLELSITGEKALSGGDYNNER
jgi:hypothetical protein